MLLLALPKVTRELRFPFLFCLLLSGCVPASIPAAMIDNIGIDGYAFRQKEFEHLEQNIKVVLFSNEESLRQTADKVFGPNGKKIKAFAVWGKDNQCVLYIKDPDWQYEPEIIGHELAHCIWGKFHTKLKEENNDS